MAKVRIPKQIGGVKIPKKVRRRAKKAVKMAERPAVREFAAAALGAAAAAKAARQPARAQAEGHRQVARAAVRIDGARFAEDIRSAALDGLRRFLEGFEEGLRRATSHEADADQDDRPNRRPES